MRITQLISLAMLMGTLCGVLTVAPLSAAPPVKPATDVQCTGCVDSTDIADGGVQGVDLGDGQ